MVQVLRDYNINVRGNVDDDDDYREDSTASAMTLISAKKRSA